MGAALDDAASIEYQNLRRIGDRRQTVRDDQRRAVTRDFL
jgi:hypothetical protein